MYLRFNLPFVGNNPAYFFLVIITTFLISVPAAYYGATFAATQIIEENFEGTVSGWNDNSIGNHNNVGKFLGDHQGSGSTATQQVYKTFTVPTGTTELSLEFDFYEIGYWQNDKFTVFVNDQSVSSGVFNKNSSDNVDSNFTAVNTVSIGSHGYSYQNFTAQIHRFSKTIQIPPGQTTVKIGFGSSDLDNGTIFVESTVYIHGWWGVDNLKLTSTYSDSTGSIAVQKSVTGDGTTFSYSTTGTGLSNFSLSPAADGSASQSFSSLAAGSYTITEDALQGYDFTSLTCTGDTDGGNSVDLTNRSVTIDLDAGETQSCTFVSTQQQQTGGGGGQTSGGGTSTTNGDPVGTTSAKFGVTPSGAASYSIPLAVPKGTADLQPQLALQYNSQDRNSILGVGWKVTGLSYINRCPTNLYIEDPNNGGIGIDPVDYDDNDQFCLNGERLRAVTGTYGADGTVYHTFFEEFSKVISHGSSATGPTSFTVYKKTGEILTYGGTVDSRFQRQTQDHVRTWALSKLANAKGNYITYKYYNDRTKGEFYITDVNYTGNDAQGLAPYNSVKFVYEDRTDKISHYKAGDEITLSKRVNKIQVLAENQLAHEYRVSYGAGDTGRSRITSITECANATTCFKPTSFEWSKGQVGPQSESYLLTNKEVFTNAYLLKSLDFNGDLKLDFMVGGVDVDHGDIIKPRLLQGQGDGNFEYKSPVLSENFAGSNFSIGDFNGDGLSDYIGGQYVYFSKGDGTFEKSSSSFNGDLKIVGDFNGDGLSDFYTWKGHNDQTVFLLNSDGTLNVKQLSEPERLPLGLQIAFQGDFNGDGRTDIYLRKSGGRYKSASYDDKVGLAQADGTFEFVTIPASTALPQLHGIRGSGDFNGDGLTDFISGKVFRDNPYEGGQYLQSNETLWLSRGDGTFFKVSLSLFAPNMGEMFSISVLPDTNGDGFSDILVSGYITIDEATPLVSRVVYLSNGDGSFRLSNIGIKTDYVDKSHLLIEYSNYYRSWLDHTIWVGDFNGDGLTDWATDDVFFHSDVLASQVPQTHISPFLPPEKVTKITNGHGLTTAITYKHLTDSTVYTKGISATGPVKDQLTPRQVVSKVEIDNGVGSQNAQSYTYEGMQYHRRGLGNLGFRKMVMTDEVTGIKTESIYSQNWANHHQGLLEESKTIAPNGIVLSHRTVDWKVRGFKDENDVFATCFRYADSSTTVKRDLNGVFLSRMIEKTTFDDYGFRTRIEIKTENEDGSENFTQVTENTFTHNTDTWRLGQLTNSVTTYSKTPSSNVTDTVVRTKAFTYDADGYLLSETSEPGDALVYTKTNVLNAYGAISSITETWGSNDTDGITETSRTTTYEFDDKVRYVTKETNPLGHSQTNAYHPILGLIISTTGPNGLTTTYEHDNFGRKILETRADGTSTSSAMDFCSENISCPTNAVYRMRTVTSGGKEQRVFMNKLNLEVKSSALLEDKWSDITTEYDVIGREVKKSQPHYTGENAYYTLTEYDILDRKTKVTRPDLSTQSATFNGLTQVSTNELGQNKTATKNLLDKDAVITNHEGQSITYSYDGAGQLLGMNANGGLTTYVYDIRGNKISDSDPDKGTWTYRYNALGKIVEQTNAKGETTRMTYDMLERMLSRVDNATAANPEQRTSTWEYDTAANGIGKLHKTTSPNYIITNTYDALSRVTSTTEKIDGTDYTTSTTYDSQSRPENITYPSGLTIKNSYDNQSNLLKVAKPDNTETWWERMDVDARGNITRADHGNGVNTHRTYDPETGRLTGIYSYKNAEIIQDLTYTKDALGNLTRREDKRLSQTETFVYDNLNRVTTINTTVGGNTSTVTMTYGITGNILSKSDVGTYTYGQIHASCTNGFAGPHAVTTVSGTKNATYCYDANGNMTSGDGRTVTYTAFDKPTKMVQNGNSAEFFYGPDRKRYKRIDNTVEGGTKTTLYVAGKAYEKITTATEIQEKHYIGDFAVITLTQNSTGGSNRTAYLHRDHLGSVDVITNETGQIQQEMSFDAFGKRREVNWSPMTASAITSFDTSTTTRGFTGHEMIDAVGLVHMNGRVYDPELGRFLSADPIVEAIDNLQTYNRYSYVRNNPLTFTDPSGFTGSPADGWGDPVIDAALGWSSGSGVYGDSSQGKTAISTALSGNGIHFTTTNQIHLTTHSHLVSEHANEDLFVKGIEAYKSTNNPSNVPGKNEGEFEVAGRAKLLSVRGLMSELLELHDYYFDPASYRVGEYVKQKNARERAQRAKNYRVRSRSKKKSIRSLLYPSRPNKSTAERADKASRNKDGELICKICQERITPDQKSTYQHNPQLVETHNKKGVNTDQDGRNKLYNDTITGKAHQCCNAKEGGQTTETYSTDFGPKYKPRGRR